MLLFALLLNLAQAQTPAKWTLLKAQTLAPQGNPAHRQLPLQLVVEAGSRWDNEQTLVAQLKKTATILDRCKIALGEVEVRTVVFDPEVMKRVLNEKPRRMTMNGEMLSAEHELSEGETSTTRPLMIMIKGGPAYRKAAAYNRAYVAGRLPYFPEIESMLNMSILTDHYVENKPVPAASPTYNTFAHELVHLLTNEGHVLVPRNLMSEMSGRNMQTGDLTQEQCQRMEGFPY